MTKKRVSEVAVAILLALAGVVAAFAVVASAPAENPSTDTTATEPAMTTPTTIPDGVIVGNVPVGGMSVEAARSALEEAFVTPLPLLAAKQHYQLAPASVGAQANIDLALDLALAAAPGDSIPLEVTVDRKRLRKFVANLAKRFDQKPVDAHLYLRKLRPWISEGKAGRAIVRPKAVLGITAALKSNRRFTVPLRVEKVPRRVTRSNFGPVIVIRRGSNHLYLYRGMRFWRRFPVATGQSAYPTPLGRFQIVVMWKDPWWYPPDSPWAKGAHPIPPGPGNPLGTRWMGLSASGVGIHGTPDSSSVGYSVSHGCIRMLISDAEWLFEHVRVGTTVFIVSA
jgi:lipoprotein-anchoring transpeptidase ErfK/SrfK